MRSVSVLCALLYFGYGSTTDCPDGWMAYHASCYFFARGNATTFYGAQDFCRFTGESMLIQLETPEENSFIKNYLDGLQAEDHWMGLTDQATEGIYRWLDGDQSLHVDWRHGAPNNRHEEDCVKFDHKANYQWDDVDCTKNAEPICEIR